MADTRDIIAASISTMRQDTPSDGGPDPSGDTPDAASTIESPEATDAAPDPTETPAGDEPDVDPAKSAADPKVDAPVVGDKKDEKPGDKKPDEKAVENDDFDKEPEFTTDAKGRKIANRIPQPRVKVMVEKAVQKAVAAKDQEHTTTVNGFKQQIDGYENIGMIMEREPDRFMEMLQKSNPAYRAYAKGGQQPAAAADHAGANDPMPQADARLADGTPTYSPEGFQKVQEWQARQIEKRVMTQVGEKYKWVDDAKAAREAQEAEIPRVRALLSNAIEKWDGFKDNQNEILTELRNDTEASARAGCPPQLTIHDAYRVVMNRKFQAERDTWAKERDGLKIDRNKQREEILAEIKTRPTTTAAVPSQQVTRPENGDNDTPRETRDIIRDSIARLKGAAA